MLSVRSFSLSTFLWRSRIALFPRPTSLLNRVISLRSVLIVSMRCGAASRAVRARLASPADCRPAPPLRVGDAARASCSRATSLLSASTTPASLDWAPSSERSACRRATFTRKGRYVACRAAEFLRLLLGLAQPLSAGLEARFPCTGIATGGYLRPAQFLATRFGRVRPRPLLFIQGLEIARRGRRGRLGRRPNPGTVLGQRRAYGEIIVQNRHALDDSAGQIVLPAPS